MKNKNEMAELAALDPAARDELTEQERHTRDQLLQQILESSPHTSTVTTIVRSRDRGRYLVAAALLGLVMVGGLVASLARPAPSSEPIALGDGALSADALASWTGEPEALDQDAPVAKNCQATLSAHPALDDASSTVLSSDLRGEVGSIIVQRGEYVAWCVGTDAIPMYVLIDGPDFAPEEPVADGVTLGPSGGRIPPDGYGFAAGRVGADVRDVTLQEDGLEITATVENGWWSAWWPSDDESLLVSGSITVVTSDGTALSYQSTELQPLK